MKRFVLAAFAVSLCLGAIALSGNQPPAGEGELRVAVEERNPWTHLRHNSPQESFHFAIVSDRTGGHRARIFSQAVEQLNLLQPAFVLSVGDLIEGYTKDPVRLATEWKEFQTYAARLQMPFFYVPGNHDLTNPTMVQEWQGRFGRAYYHFLYRDVLFLCLNSDDPFEEKEPRLSKEQIAYFQQVLKENPGPRWTIVCLHKPMWVFPNVDRSGWLDFEQLLQGRPYTVFAGHVHRYQKFVRQGMNYYQLATTGGGSRLRGLKYGEFDHIVWATMKKDGGPVLANVMLDGILPEDLRAPVTAEEGTFRYNRKPTQPVRGTVLFDGAPAAGAQVVFFVVDAKDLKKGTRVADALVEADGTFVPSTYDAFDGLPAGEYIVTVERRDPWFEPSGKKGPHRLPEQYASPNTTDLRVTVKTGPNEISLKLAR